MNTIANLQDRERAVLSLRNVLLIAVGVRLLLPLLTIGITNGNSQFRTRDTDSYIQPAIALISEGQFARWDEPELIRTPGYPILLLPGIALGNVESVTITLQIALSTLTVFLVYQITMLLFERADIAILSALLFALEPISILYSSKLMSETLFTTLIALFLYGLIRYWKEKSLAHLVLAAVALAAATYVRPIAYYLPILVFILLLAWALATDPKNTRRLVHLFIFLLASMGLIGLWQIRNSVETGYSGFSAAAEHSLYFWDAASVLAVIEGIPPGEMKEQMGLYDEETYFRNFPEQRGWERSEIFRSMGKEGLKIIANNAGTYSVLVVNGILRTILDPGATEYLRMFGLYPEAGGLLDLIIDQGLVAAVALLFDDMPLVFWANLLLGSAVVIYLFLAVFGVARSRFANTMPMTLFLAVTAYFLVLSAAGLGFHRARHAIMPIVCVVAGYGLCVIVGSMRAGWSAHRGRFAPVAYLKSSVDAKVSHLNK